MNKQIKNKLWWVKIISGLSLVKNGGILLLLRASEPIYFCVAVYYFFGIYWRSNFGFFLAFFSLETYNEFISFIDASTNLSELFVVPFITYLNADTQKKQIIEENRGKCGIYRWTNLTNTKSYIGSSSDLGKRFKSYYNYSYINSLRGVMLIYKALIKYRYSQCRYFRILWS